MPFKINAIIKGLALNRLEPKGCTEENKSDRLVKEGLGTDALGVGIFNPPLV